MDNVKLNLFMCVGQLKLEVMINLDCCIVADKAFRRPPQYFSVLFMAALEERVWASLMTSPIV